MPVAVAGYTSQPNEIPRVLARLFKDNIDTGALDITAAVSDIQIESSVTQTNTLTVSLNNLPLSIMYSGMFTCDSQTGDFPPLDIEVDGIAYRLYDVAGNTDTTQANVVLTFQSRGAPLMNALKGPVKATRSSKMTRAEFIYKRSQEVKDFGGINFFCPDLNVVQPIGGGNESVQNATATKSSAKVQKQNVEVNPKSGSASTGRVPNWTAAQNDVANQIMSYAQGKGASKAGAAGLVGNAFQESSLNPKMDIGYDGCGLWSFQGITTGEGGLFRAWARTHGWSVSSQVDFLWQRLQSSYTSLIPILKNTNDPQAAARSFEETYEGAGTPDMSNRTSAAQQAFNALSGGSKASSASTDRPYEFSIGKNVGYWTGCTNLASEVNWLLFWHGNDLYYMNAYDLINTTPVATIDPVTGVMKSKVVLAADGSRTFSKHEKTYKGVVSNFSFDNSNNKVTDELTLDLICKPAFIRAGDVIQMTDPAGGKAPWSTGKWGGRWIVTDNTTDILNSYSALTLDIPGTSNLPGPKDEPLAQSTSGSSGVKNEGGAKTAQALDSAGRELNSKHLTYSQVSRTLIKNPPQGAAMYDCSASTAWCLLKAGFDLPGGATWGDDAPVSGDFLNWGDAGEGSYITVWVKPGTGDNGHVFFEVKKIEAEDMQGNTVNPYGPGFGYFNWNTPATGGYGGPNPSSVFVPRHPPGW